MKDPSRTNQELLKVNASLKERIKELEQSESDLKMNEQRFRSLSEASLEAVVFSEDGIIVDANKALNHLFGYENEELRGKQAACFIVPEKRPFTIEKMLSRTEGAYETLGLKKDGSTFPIEVIPREFEYNGKQFRISAVRDLTERKQAEEKLKENEAAIQRKLKAIIEPEGDLGTLELADIVDKDLFRGIMEEFHRITGIASAIIDIHGEVLVGVGWQDICSKFHRCHHETLRNCIESDTILAQDVMPGTFKTYLCKNNLVDMATPIVLKDRHLGNFFIGQYLYDDDSHDVSLFIRQARQYGFNEEDYLAAYMRVPRFKRETADAIMSFYFEFTKMITNLSFNNMQLARSLAERKTAAEALGVSEQRYRELVTNANSAILRMDSKGFIAFFNEFAQRLFGYTEDEVLGRNVVGTIVPETDSAGRDLRSMILDIARQPSLYAQNENENMRRDGSRVWISWTNTPIFNTAGEILEILCIGNDITARKQAEEALKQSETRLSNIIEFLPDATFAIDRDGSIIAWNRAIEEMTGYSADMMLGKGNYEYAIPFYGERRPILVNFLSSWDDGMAKSYSFIKKDGDTLYTETDVPFVRAQKRVLWAKAAPLFDEEGNIAGAIESIRDITDRNRVEEELNRQSEAMAASVDGVAILDQDQNYIYLNDAHASIYGYESSDELLGKTWRVLYNDSELKRFESEIMPRFSEEGRWRGEAVGRKKDGSEFFQDLSLTALKNGGLICVVSDITERKRLESQFRQAQKMESIGTLAGGIAHDFNNILTALMGYATLMQMKIETSSPLGPYLDQILSASQKAADLTKSLLAFSRRQPVTLAPLDMNNAVKTAKKLLKRLLTEDIDFVTSYDKNDTVVMADRTQVDQILFNLVTNARDAMPKGGNLTVKTDIVDMDGGFIGAHGFGQAGRYVVVSVSDTGEGMDEATREKIFDPFFTTKELDKGTGLGLATVYGIVKQHNGYITVDSELGRGTTFYIYLPAVNMKVNEKKGPATVIEGGKETILIAEDNGEVRHFVREALRQHGYTTIEANDGQDAIDKFNEHGRIDLVIIDSVMPRKNGREACEQMRQADPHIRVIFTSGYTRDIVLEKGIGEGELDFISKPLSLDKLLRKVREVLDR